MTEEELDSTPVEAELVNPSLELMKITREADLSPDLANEFRINFEEHFRMASEWAKKAKKIIVTDASQQAVMQEARTARLFLREKRLEIERFRVQRKEYFLKGGRAIDKVANFLKDTIIPIENYLDSQEHFVELRKKAEDERILAEAYAKQEAERLEKEAADRVALAKAQEENAKLRKEQAERDKVEEERRRALQEKIDKERAIERSEQERIFKENNAKLARERAEREKVEAELRAKQQADAKAEADKLKAEESLKKADDSTKLKKLMEDIQAIEYPTLKSESAAVAMTTVHNLLIKAIDTLKPLIIEEET